MGSSGTTSTGLGRRGAEEREPEPRDWTIWFATFGPKMEASADAEELAELGSIWRESELCVEHAGENHGAVRTGYPGT